MNPDAAIERLYDLHPGTTPVEEGSPHERPHKPLLLLAALDLIDDGLATPERIPWSRELRDRFSARFLLVYKHNDQDTPENPFYYLQNQGFWQAWIEEGNTRLKLQSMPLVRDMGRLFARPGLDTARRDSALSPRVAIPQSLSAAKDKHRSPKRPNS